MNIEKAEKLFSLMKQFGVEHFKTDKLEIKMSHNASGEKTIVPKVEVPQIKAKGKKVPPSQAAPPVENVIPHHVNEAAKLLRLSDNDLVDKLFPEEALSG